MDKQLKMMETILYLYEKCKKLIAMGMPMRVLRESSIFEHVIAIKYDVSNEELDKFEDYRHEIDAFYDHVIATNA